MWLDHTQFITFRGRERSDDFERRTLSEVIDVSLVREPQAGDPRPHETLGAALNPLDDPARLGGVGRPCLSNERRQLWRGVDEKPRVDRNAVAADAGTGFEDLHSRVAIGERNQIPDVE